MSKPNKNFLKNYSPNGNLVLDASAIAGGMAFLEGQLEKIDPKIREPLTSTWWPRDIVAKTGGGFVEYTSAFNVDYATIDGDDDGIIGGETNAISIMQADIGKDLFKVFNWARILRISYINQQKARQIALNIEEFLNKGIKLAHDKVLDKNVYTGFERRGTYGLINNPGVTTVMASENSLGNTEWALKSPDDMLADVNKIMNDTWAASEYDLSGMANHILLPPEQYSKLVSRKVSEAGNISVLNFLLENNIGRNQGVDLFIGPLPFLKGAGTGGSDRMIGYANNEDRLRFHLTVALNRAMVSADAATMSYISAFVAQFSQVEFLFLQPVEYMDGI
jgi:hypothetical protein